MGARDAPAEGAYNSIRFIILGRRDKKKTIRLIITGLISAFLLLFLSGPQVLAVDPASPDTFEIKSALACRHVYETDDFILIVHYEIHYESDQPADPVDEVFSFRMLDTTGTQLIGSSIPYPYNNYGYDEGVVSFYFSAADAPTWGLPYIISIQGSPVYFASPPVMTYTMTAEDYSTFATQEDNRVLLGNHILDVAEDLEVDWQTEMIIDTGTKIVLSTTGEYYFLGTIHGIKEMAPQIFSTSMLNPDYSPGNFTMAEANAWATRYDGTWVGDALDNIEDLFGIQWNIITGIGVLILIIGLFAICQIKFSTTSPAAIPASLVLLCGTIMGFVAPVIMALITLMMVLFSGYILLFRNG